MEFRIRTDKRSQHIITDLNNFDEAVEFVKNNDCNGLHVRSVLGTAEIVPDFSRFKVIADKLIWLSFSMEQSAKKIANFEDIYSLKKLQSLIFNNKESFTIDLSEFPALNYIGGEYWTGLQHIDKATGLEAVVFQQYSKTDLCEFSTLTKLETLHLYSSKIKSLDCLEKLGKLQWLSLSRDQALTDISALFASKSLQRLNIEKCKHLTQAAVFNKKSDIRELTIDEIDSLSFLPNMPLLEKLTFLDLKDGNMEPLFKATKLGDVHFHPHKKHYTHTKAEVEAKLKGK